MHDRFWPTLAQQDCISFFGRYVRNRVGNLIFTVPSKLAALRTLDDKTRLYQILFKRNRPPVPHTEYTNPLVRAAVEQNREAVMSHVPVLATLALHRDARRIADLDPHRARTGSIGAVHPGDDALGAKPASVPAAAPAPNRSARRRVNQPRLDVELCWVIGS